MSTSPFRQAGFPSRIGPIPYLALATWSQTASSVVQQGVAVLAVFIRQQDGLSLSQMGLVTSATSVGIMIGMLLGGPQVDRRGPRTVLGVGTLWAAGAALVLGELRGFPGLLAGLFLLGLGLAAFPSSGTRAVFDAFRDRPRGLVMGIRQTGVPLGSAVAAAVLPPLALAWGVTGVFRADAALLLLAGVPFLIFMTSRREGPGVPVPGRSWRELKGALGPFLVAAMLVSGQYVALAFTITDLSQFHGWAIAAAGLGLALIQIGGGVGRITLGWWSDRHGGRRPPAIMLAAGTGAVAALLFGAAPPATPAFLLAPLLFLFGMGAVGWNGLTLTWAGERVPSSRSGQAMSLTGSVVFLGSALYPPLFGWVVDTTGQFRVGWWALAALLAAALGVLWQLGRRERSGVVV